MVLSAGAPVSSTWTDPPDSDTETPADAAAGSASDSRAAISRPGRWDTRAKVGRRARPRHRTPVRARVIADAQTGGCARNCPYPDAESGRACVCPLGGPLVPRELDLVGRPVHATHRDRLL